MNPFHNIASRVAVEFQLTSHQEEDIERVLASAYYDLVEFGAKVEPEHFEQVFTNVLEDVLDTVII